MPLSFNSAAKVRINSQTAKGFPENLFHHDVFNCFNCFITKQPTPNLNAGKFNV